MPDMEGCRTMPRMCFPLACFLAFALSGCHQSAGIRLGGELPPVTLSDVHGKTIDLPADIKGKVALVRFWSISCPLCCKELLKAIEEIYQKYKDRGFIAVTINVDPPPASDEEFRKLQFVHYPFLIDPGWAAAKSLGIKSVPITLILDEQGIVREKISGDAPPEFFEQLVTRVLYKGGFYD
ncbi:TlpA disulfide reductase family protein [Methylococcus sp. Mc7]|uniref:TlpA family protein disulfide reductase n=1 Tax=Methylococcus sp. Mc7 TaxID=2860258 RepID=UPI001C52726C|nr:TlpA disulfide reductase family protein [Methylococcus sp. Mc7]QXP84382.1 TlpA family protein disulfide reductase [Methylococcus sp. Mc7]